MANLRRFLIRLLRPVRMLVGRFVIPQWNFTGPNGCIQTAASFIAWNQIEGDYLEFGVYRGESFAAAFHAIEDNRRNLPHFATDQPEYSRWLTTPPRYFALDSFEGLPLGEMNRDADFGVGAYACSEVNFRKNIAREGVDLRRVITIPGFYDKTLKPEAKSRHRLKKAALVMIDCDLYESTVFVLDFLTDLVAQGTILIFHDWFRFKGSSQCGEQRAYREWLAKNPHIESIEYWREGPQAVSFIVNIS